MKNKKRRVQTEKKSVQEGRACALSCMHACMLFFLLFFAVAVTVAVAVAVVSEALGAPLGLADGSVKRLGVCVYVCM